MRLLLLLWLLLRLLLRLLLLWQALALRLALRLVLRLLLLLLWLLLPWPLQAAVRRPKQDRGNAAAGDLREGWQINLVASLQPLGGLL